MRETFCVAADERTNYGKHNEFPYINLHRSKIV